MSFFQQHGCASQDAQQKYNSRAAQLYREKLHNQAAAAMRLHGTKVRLFYQCILDIKCSVTSQIL